MRHGMASTLFEQSESEHKWLWDHPNEVDSEIAELTASGVVYTIVVNPGAPYGGPGMNGAQTFEDFTRNGPRADLDMPPEIEQEIRRAIAGFKGERKASKLEWRLIVDGTLASRLFQVQADVDGRNVVSWRADSGTPPPHTLFDGTVHVDHVKLGAFVAFASPTGAAEKVHSDDVVLEIPRAKHVRTKWYVDSKLALRIETKQHKLVGKKR